MNTHSSTIQRWMVLALALLLTGCGQPYVMRKSTSAEFAPDARIAVLPFDNLTNQDQVAAKVTAYFQTLLTGRQSFGVVEAGTTFEALRRHRIRSAILLNEAQIDTLAAELGIQYFISGSVLEYTEIENTYLGRVPQVSIDVRMVDCRSKRTVWTGVSNDSGDRKELLFGIGVTRSADDLARRMIQAMVANIEGLFKN